jgi:hypothetical protein
MSTDSRNVAPESSGKPQMFLAFVGFMEWHFWTYIGRDLDISRKAPSWLIDGMDFLCWSALVFALISLLRGVSMYRKASKRR